MAENNRQYKRLDKVLTILYCFSQGPNRNWDMSVVKNISVGGVMFIAPGDAPLHKDTRIHLKIGIPEIAPNVLILEAVVVDKRPCFNPKISEIRAKFINVTDENRRHLSIIEKIIELQEAKLANRFLPNKEH